jgi:hypothetical protein
MLVTTIVVPAGAAHVAAEPQPLPSIDRAVVDALDVGSARVTVKLIVADGSSADSIRQRAIETVQEQVLAGLAGTQFRLARRPTTVPFLTLEIDREALQRLTAMHGLVERVYLDTRVEPQHNGALGRARYQAGTSP